MSKNYQGWVEDVKEIVNLEVLGIDEVANTLIVFNLMIGNFP
jgi:hypothetical protein